MNIDDISEKFDITKEELFGLLCVDDVDDDKMPAFTALLELVHTDEFFGFISSFPNIEYLHGIEYAKYYLAGRSRTFEGERHADGMDHNIRYYMHGTRMYFDSEKDMAVLLLKWQDGR